MIVNRFNLKENEQVGFESFIYDKEVYSNILHLKVDLGLDSQGFILV